MERSTPQEVFCDILSPLSLQNTYSILVRYANSTSLSNSRTSYPKYSYIFRVHLDGRSLEIEKCGPKDPDPSKPSLLQYEWREREGWRKGISRMNLIMAEAEERQDVLRVYRPDNQHNPSRKKFGSWRRMTEVVFSEWDKDR